MKEKLKEKDAITLLALIITIIVLLILSMVTIKIVLDGGIIDKAKDAVDKYSKAQDDEKEKMVSLELSMNAGELIEKYPLHCEFDGNGTDPGILLLDNNVIDLYEYILEKYNTNYDNLTLTTAIKAANRFYEIYDQEVQKNEDEWIRNNFWKKLVGGLVSTNNEEDENKIEALQIGSVYSKYHVTTDDNNIYTFITEKNGVKYTLIAGKWDENYGYDAGTWVEDQEFNEYLNYIFPGGHFPVTDVTGTTSSDFTFLPDNGEIIKITEENVNDFELFDLTGNGKTDFVGSIVYAFNSDNSTSDEKNVGILCHNMFIINSETGEIVYIDDSGIPNKSFL